MRTEKNCRVIAVANQKGGVGKTVTCVNLGIGLAREGKKVLLIDADPQGSLTISLGYPEPDQMEYSLATAMMKIINDEQMDAKQGILDEYHAYANIIRENMEIDILYQQYPYDKELLDGIYDLILETVLCKSGNVIIASNEYPLQLVKSKFLKLNSSHIQYVMDCLKETTSKVRNIKKYLLAALFNAPATMKSYYQAEVNHDMPQFVVRAI